MTSPEIPPPLARFPLEVRSAYLSYRASGDEGALRQVILAAVKDFMPQTEPPRTQALLLQERLIEDLGFDSLAVAETVFFFEDLFKVTIRNEELLALHSVGELCDFVVARLRQQAPAP